MEPSGVRKEDLLGTLPPRWPEADLLARIREATVRSGRKVAVLDDDPTGTQTVHDLPVVTEWGTETLAAVWEQVETTFYLLTNSRRFPVKEAARINREIAANLARVARERGVAPVVISRSDSTLRGHYPGEVEALMGTLEQELDLRYDGVLIVPFFPEGGRFTIDDVHWVQQGERLTPAAQTEFARDPSFGYRHSDLREWVEEKTEGRVPSDAVMGISIRELREGGPNAVMERLLDASDQQVIVANAAAYRDLEVLVWGLVKAEARGKRFLYRTAASFVKVRGGIPDRELLNYEELRSEEERNGLGGLTVVGSYVQCTTDQLRQALDQQRMSGVELRVARTLEPEARGEEISQALTAVESGLARGQDVVLYTSRELVVPGGVPQLEVAQRVSSALAEVLRRLALRPAYLIGKGGITSSDLATEGLSVRQAHVLGQILPGVPVWRLGAESKYPGLPYVVFPGNVGGRDALAQAIRLLRGEQDG